MTTSEQRAPYWFSAFPFPHGHFSVHRVRGREAISKPYRFDVTVTASTFLGDNIEQLSVGHRASLVIRCGKKPRLIPGIVESVRAEGLRLSGKSVQTTFRIVPMLSLLRLQRGSRVFQDMRVDQVIDHVLHAAGIPTCWNLIRRYPVHDYITQYEESDLAFVHRLIAEAGIFYAFTSHASAVSNLLGAIGELATGAIAGAVGDFAELASSAATGAPQPAETVVFGDDASVYPGIPLTDTDDIIEEVSSAVGATVNVAANIAGGDAGIGASVGGVAGLILSMGPAPSISYLAKEGLATERADKVSELVATRRVRSDVSEYRDFDPSRPSAPLVSRSGDVFSAVANPLGLVADVATTTKALASAAARDPLSTLGSLASTAIGETLLGLVAQRRLETYEHHGHFLFPDPKEVEGMGDRVRRRTTRKRVTAKGEGGCPAFTAGHRFQLEHHPLSDLNREYVITAVEHWGDVGKEERIYENRFEAVPAEVTFPPVSNRRPILAALLTATVVGPPGDDIYVDAAGRIKVCFHWDRRGRGTDNTCWIRCIHPISGAAFGHQFIPRVGMEVAVAFEGGDPDKPIVQGCLYNGTHPPPFALPSNKTQSGIRTRSSPSGSGYNELMFEDASRNERIYLRAERDYEEEVNHDHSVLVKNDETIKVLANRRDEVGKNASYEVRGDREDIVRGDASVHHFGSRVDVVEKSLDQRVTGVRTTRLENQDQLEVRGRAEHRYEDDLSTRVVGNEVHIVGAHDAKRSLTMRVEGVGTFSAEDGLVLESAKGITLRVGKSTLRLGDDGIEMVGAMTRMAGEKGSVETSKDGVTLKSEKVHAHLGEKVLIKSDEASLAMGKEFKVDAPKVLFNSPEQATEAPPPDPKPPTEIVLKATDGRLLPSQRFLVELPDRSQRTGVTDKEGRAKLHLPGSGKIRFPELVAKGTPTSAWEPKVVQQGDHVEKLAFLRGAEANDVWNHSTNAELKSKRQNMNHLLPGDILHLPKEPMDWKDVKDGTKNDYVFDVPITEFSAVLRNDRGPIANASYVVTGLPLRQGDEPPKGTTGASGEIKLRLPVIVREFLVTLPVHRLGFRFRIGDLDPHNEPSGARQRLQNLGFMAASIGPDDDISFSIADFQRAYGLPVTRLLDPTTLDVLAKAAAGLATRKPGESSR